MNFVTKTHVKYAAAGVALSGAMLAAGAGVAGAEPMPDENLSLSIGEVTIVDSADMVKATEIAGAVCNIDTAQANTIAEKATSETSAQTVCNLPGGAVTFSQASAVSELPGSAPASDWPNESGHSATPADPMNPMVPGSSNDTVEQLPS